MKCTETSNRFLFKTDPFMSKRDHDKEDFYVILAVNLLWLSSWLIKMKTKYYEWVLHTPS